MEFFKNFPLFTIILAFVAVVLCAILKGKASRIITIIVDSISVALGIWVLILTLKEGSIEYPMGHFPAPFCNEIRFGVLESIFAIFFPLIILLSLLGGQKHIKEDISENKEHFMYVLLNLVLVALIALIYTNDVFTGYVFLEISTLASIGLIMIKEKGNTTVAAIRYMIFNLIGSGLFLLGIIFLYDLTGYLSMSYIKEALTTLVTNNKNTPAIICSTLLISVGLGIKSGMFPFYFWMPDAYGESTTTSASIVSGVISKGYIILLIKMIYRTFGWDTINSLKLTGVYLIVGTLGMIFGSLSAIRQGKINRMISFSSAAQIGYIYMGIGLGPAGIVGAIIQILCHACTKPLLFVSSNRLISVSNGDARFKSLKGSGKKDIIAGIGYTIGSLSMVGFPFFAGFATKCLLIMGALDATISTLQVSLALASLVISTLLNTIYFLRTIITIYSPLEVATNETIKEKSSFAFKFSVIGFSLINIVIGSLPYIIVVIQKGLDMFA